MESGILYTENGFLLVVYLLGLCAIFGIGDLGIWIHQKYFCKHAEVAYWSAYKRSF